MNIKPISNISKCIALFLITLSCSEGDIINMSIDFEGQLQNCSNTNDNTFVFYKIDSENNRSLSVGFTSNSFDIAPQNIANISTTEPIEINLNTSTNQLFYREFNTEFNGDEYYCTSVPPSIINVSQELVSSTGVIEISYQNTDNTNTFIRTVTLKNVTFVGDEIAIRKEVLVLGSDEVVIN